MEEHRTEQPIVGPGTSTGHLSTAAFLLLSTNGDLNVWSFEEPWASTVWEQHTSSVLGSTGNARARVTLCAPKEFSPLKAYMHFAQIRDTSSGKQAQYRKYYGNEDRFMRTVNQRFDTVHSLGVLKGMLMAAKDKRKQKNRLAMAVKILGESRVTAAADAVR